MTGFWIATAIVSILLACMFSYLWWEERVRRQSAEDAFEEAGDLVDRARRMTPFPMGERLP